MSELSDQVGQSIRRRGLLRRGQRVLVAVSGGVDSMVLLHLLNVLAARSGWRLTVAHLNHQLRGRSSDADDRLVLRTAKQLGLPVVNERADVRAFAAERGISVEMAARRLRHDFLARAAVERGIRTLALAHHADDQLELFFLRVLRGSGGEGLAGMEWRSASPSNRRLEIIRPLLGQPKAALETYAAMERVPFRMDATNASLDIQRNRIRHQLLPLLRKHYQPALDRVVLRTMEVLGAEATFVAQAAEEWLERFGGQSPKSAVIGQRKRSAACATTDLLPFAALPVAVQRRCIHEQLLRLGVAPEFDRIEQLRWNDNTPVSVSMVGTLGGSASTPACSKRVIRDTAGLVHVVEAARAEFNGTVCPVDLSGSREVSFSGLRIRWRWRRGGSRPATHAPGTEYFDAERVGASIVLRHWQPGDRFQPIGMARPVKLQDLFTNQKIPREQRRRLLVATTREGTLFWVEGLRISERFKLTKASNRRLQWSWQRAS